ncbi:SDR family NAD(P)-dependent oxidoreductase [Rhizorhapis suberifaciens]|uniref:NAD(P)-dependent dehydrogenase (Short-subunit alcohol dehydrogenase family) n=1 Tax=Rhizorhapis suberifaciens TaxID=13656 RepID=A0A840HSK2_9SPHN|nr:SDR family oxidoreductase [Rhizorhapis suberifaciens]MBB4641142.1 NAD(P)-dependent dehydrogenase (short-subunit alcohol dehydrogenase family) [Rhizorhapis suberifaciens]
MRFHEKTVLVIGGNSGIGQASARAFAGEGANLFITGRDQRTLDATKTEIGGACTAFRADVSDPDSLDPVIAAIKERHGTLDALFVNAGVGGFSPARELTPELWDHINDINCRGCFFAAQKALPLMTKGGSILFTGSIGSVLALPGNTAYAAAKAGLRAVARIMAKELVDDGIRVNMISPGPIETPLMNRNAGMDSIAVDGLRQTMIAAVPMKRMGEADEVARAVLFLSSQEASFITGVDLFVDGGCVEL